MKIVICTPHNGETKAPFTHSLARLLVYTGKVGVPGPAGRIRPDLDFVMIGGSNIANNRINLAEITVEAEADYLLWLDSDMAFPHYALERLISANQAIIGCNYGRRDNPTGPTAFTKKNGKPEPVWTTAELAEEGLVERVHSLGLGVCPMAVPVFQKIERPWFEWGPDGEDGYFFAKIADAGIPVMLDHRLSWEVKHITYAEITNAHTVNDRAEWLQAQAKVRKHG
jgi:hypothetical protein